MVKQKKKNIREFDDAKKIGRKDDDTILHCALKSYIGGISLNIGYLALTKP